MEESEILLQKNSSECKRSAIDVEKLTSETKEVRFMVFLNDVSAWSPEYLEVGILIGCKYQRVLCETVGGNEEGIN